MSKTKKCECGKEVELKKYIGFPEEYKVTEVWEYIKGDDFVYMGKCGCGKTVIGKE